ncbi:MAG: GH3 auxin-responsive promoter family protein [Bacteroidetes bacterium]|nr:GH3 auxin-responsive promoter family protein [Bacteroidota bacterium]
MPILNSIASWWMRKRMHQIALFMKYPHDVQEEWLRRLIEQAKGTEWGKKYDYTTLETYRQFNERIPLQDYDTIKPFIERARRGEQNILWPGETRWFAKSSGTTSDKSKFIPVTENSLEESHYNGGRDMVAIHCSNRPETKLFTGKNLALAGSYQVDKYGQHESYHGDLSAIVIRNLPLWAEFLRAPDLSIALIDEWEKKLDKMARATMDENVTSIAGVPSWLLILLKRILQLKGKASITEVWPNLEVFFHGGVNFSPYKDQFKRLFGSDTVSYIELYNASEGFFGIQDQAYSDELLLMLDYGIYYEFIPMNEWGEEAVAIPLSEVELHKNYAVVISTNAGLWRYILGDTVKFTSLIPYRFKITGRTKHFINAFGEELIIDNADNALKIACEKTGAVIKEYAAAPAYMNDITGGLHEWLIEFEQPPENIGYFGEVLDNALKSLNSDYEAKRYNNFILRAPLIHIAGADLFYKWMKVHNKLGGQNKIPRLSNDRKLMEELLNMNNEK